MVNVVGFEYRKYTSRRDNREVEGYNVFFTDDTPRQNLTGQRVFQEWLSVPLFQRVDLQVGDEVTILYNRYGRIEDIRVG